MRFNILLSILNFCGIFSLSNGNTDRQVITLCVVIKALHCDALQCSVVQCTALQCTIDIYISDIKVRIEACGQTIAML